MQRRLWIVCAAAVIIMAGGWYEYGQKTAPPAGLPSPAAVSRPAEMTVYVSGAVCCPGVVRLDAAARVLDAVNACGGPLPTAASAKVNLAQALKDGVQIHVPAQTGAPPGDAPPDPAADRVNINTADAGLLDRLPGVGPATAAAIVRYRGEHGLFENIADLKKVRGIGESKYQKLAEKITI